MTGASPHEQRTLTRLRRDYLRALERLYAAMGRVGAVDLRPDAEPWSPQARQLVADAAGAWSQVIATRAGYDEARRQLGAG